MTAETSNARGEWVLVPRVPTPEMIDAWRDAPDLWDVAYAAMLAAAPQPPSGGEVCRFDPSEADRHRCYNCGLRIADHVPDEDGARCKREAVRQLREITAPPSAPVGMKTLSEFMAEQEALHPGIHDKVQAATDELRASLAQQPAAPSETVNVLGMPEFDGLLDHIYEYGTAAEGVIEKANAFARAVIARYAPKQPAAVDGSDARDAERYRWLRRALLGAEDEPIDHLLLEKEPETEAEFDAAVDAALATQHQEPTT